MPRLWILSDLHLEAVPYPEAFRPSPPPFDALVAAGDVWQGQVTAALDTLVRLAAGNPVVCVLGNHEPWNGILHRTRTLARKEARRRGIALLDDDGQVVEVAGARFVGGSLWADGALAGAQATPGTQTGERFKVAVARDGTLLADGEEDGPSAVGSYLRPVTGAAEAVLHRRARAGLERALLGGAEPSGSGKADGDGHRHAGHLVPPRPPLVVVTHHAPHPDCLPPYARPGTWAAGNSASDLSHLTDAGVAALWVHGHLHVSHELVRSGGTTILCNAAGPRFANPAFRDDLVVEV